MNEITNKIRQTRWLDFFAIFVQAQLAQTVNTSVHINFNVK